MDDLHSAKQPPEDEATLPAEIVKAIAKLRDSLPNDTISALRWNDNYVAVPLVVDVQLPGRGPVRGVDIRKREPLVLLFNRKSFPYVAPLVYSDRRDFPKTTFPHINVTKPGHPAWLCLHRGSIDAWFAEHTILDLVDRAKNWLRDAARNRLVPAGDGFEPTRAADTLGAFYYKPGDNLDIPSKRRTQETGASGHALLAFDLLDDTEKAAIGANGYTVRQVMEVPPDAYEAHKTVATVINALAEKPEHKGLFQRRLFGLLVWAAESEICYDYFGELPQTLGELKKWANALGIPLEAAMQHYLSNSFHLFGGVPVIVAVKRPGRILGTSSDVELLNFLIIASGEHWPKDGVWDEAATVYLADHRTALSPEFAQEISAIGPQHVAEPTVLFGAGALGSKIATHLARSGAVSLKIVDHAKLSPHNLVRHALGGRAIGQSKAEALKDELDRIYPGVSDLPIVAKFSSVLNCLAESEFFEGYNNIVDATASNVVFNILRDSTLPDTVRLHRVEIADRGRLGLLSVEGRARGPRIDDLQAQLFDRAVEDEHVGNWLRETKKMRVERLDAGGLEDIQIGLSCSSATMRLSDEVVSYHAAAITKKLRFFLSKQGNANSDGALFTTFLGEDGEAHSSAITVSPPLILDAGSGWEVRIAAAVADQMKERLAAQSPRETGGILVGRISHTRKVIHVTRLVPAPADSRGTPYVFTRGTEKLPELLHDVQQKTGGLLTYIGEWHTHPMGGVELSDLDKSAVISLRSILDKVGHPTLVTIVTPEEIKPHLFEPDSPPVTIEYPRWGIVRAIGARFRGVWHMRIRRR